MGTATERRLATGTSEDWFNLSAQLGQADQEGLALEACLHGMAQQIGRPFINADGSFDWPKGVQPEKDLLAHALQFAAATGSPYLAGLVALSGYDAATSTGQPGWWGWRNYQFTMSALVAVGRPDEAVRLGQRYLSNGGDDERILVGLARIMDGLGQRREAEETVQRFLDDHPNVTTAQAVTLLLDWDDGTNPENTIGLADRGLKSLALDQATASTSNLYLMRGLANDRAAHDPARNDRCRHITEALKDYSTASQLGIRDVRANAMRERRVVLERLAADLGCKDSVPPAAPGLTEDAAEANKAHGLLSRLAAALSTGSKNEDLVLTARQILDQADGALRRNLVRTLRRVAKDDDVDADTRGNAAFVLDQLDLDA